MKIMELIMMKFGQWIGKCYESTCLCDSVCGIFDNESYIITKSYIVWFNSNKLICKGKVIKIVFIDLP